LRATVRFTHLALEMSFLLAVAALGGCATTPAQFDPLPLGKAVAAPTGFLAFCHRRPDQCETSAPVVDPDRLSGNDRPEGVSGGRLRLSPELAAEIGEVNVAINRAIKPGTDIEAFGMDNYWGLPLSDGPRAEGNCKDYALEKRRQLVDDGVPSNALSLAILVTPQNEVHAVLVVSTDQGDMVMDNLTDEVRPWRQAGYRWLARQTPGAPLQWVEVAHAF
jgi:predicted transglutaminase-like cysteine proteinase